jgi:DNA modification methylase
MKGTTSTPPSTTEIREGDSDDILDEFDEDSFHAVVCDPPYFLGDDGFMPSTTQGWDSFADERAYQEWCQQWAEQCLRVLKPGGHLIAFGGNTRHHRLFSGVEDAGFEIRDTLTYLFGTGFPKGATVSQWMGGEDADRWSGYKSDLKPSVEFAVLARAPLSEDAIYKNVMKHGTGALNIDRTRLPSDAERPKIERNVSGDTGSTWVGNVSDELHGSSAEGTTNEGRYPANLLLDSEAARLLDEQSGELDPGGNGQKHSAGESIENDVYGDGYTRTGVAYADEGGASRFFKTAEPTRFRYGSKASTKERILDGQVENEHPIVKPLDIMEWLVTLATAPGQRVLDPFAGSGTTIMACKRLGRDGVGIEKDPDYAELARERVALADEVETDFEGTLSASHPDQPVESADEPPSSMSLEEFGDD